MLCSCKDAHIVYMVPLVEKQAETEDPAENARQDILNNDEYV